MIASRSLLARVLWAASVLDSAGCGAGGRAEPIGRSAAVAAAGDRTHEPAPSAPAVSTDVLPARPGTLAPESLVPIVEMKPPRASAMAADLESLRLDVNALPPIEKLEPTALRGVMKLLARSLGVKCAHCHQDGDFAAPTPQKRVAAKMWDEFVVKLAMADSSPLFCDSCHQGRVKQLDRGDKKRLARWMDDNFVHGLNRKDAVDHACETCHVDMDMTFLTQWRAPSSP